MPDLARRGPFSYDNLTRTSNGEYVLVKSKFSKDNGEILEVIVNGTKIEGDGSVASSSDASAQSPAHGFYVDSLTNPTKITLVSNPASGTIDIYRLSNRSTAQVDFAPGSVIREQDLDNTTNQTLHVAQEAMDIALRGVVLDTDDKFSANSKVVKSVADGVADNDAVNKGQLTATEVTTNDYKLEAKDWAQKNDGGVKAYSGGSVTGGEIDHSAKAWSIGGTGVTDTASKGAAKEWAIETSGNVDGTSFSAKEYAQGTQASTGGSAKDYAQKVDGGVSGATSDHSAKAWAVGGTGVTTTASKGASKEWAIATGLVDTADYSSKTYAQSATAGSGTYGGSAKGWASTAHGAAVPGAGADDRSALHYATDA
ncbi:MAG: putative tail fiber protein, partial [Prokaryotic dsDNA virus sp.]